MSKTYHFGTNYGSTPWCVAYKHINQEWVRTSDLCCTTEDTILAPNKYCPDCIKVHEEIHGPWTKKPLIPIHIELNQCSGQAIDRI